MKKIIKISLLVIVSLFFLMVLVGQSIRLYHKIQENRRQRHWELEKAQACDCARQMAIENIKLGNYEGNHYPMNSYAYDVAISDYGIQLVYTGNVLKKCGGDIMEYAIKEKFGADIYDRIEHKADSLWKVSSNQETSPDGMYYMSGEFDEKDYDRTYNLVLDRLKKSGYLNVTKRKCFPNQLIFDFVVKKDGTISNVRIIMKLTKEINETVKQVMNNLPYKWKPIKVDGKVVNYRMEMRISFGEDPTQKLFIIE